MDAIQAFGSAAKWGGIDTKQIPTSPPNAENLQQWQQAAQSIGNLKPNFDPTSLQTPAIPEIAATAPIRGTRQMGTPVADFIHSVDNKLKEGDTLRSAVLAGEPVNLHQAMIALQEASVSFTLMMEFRNKLMEGYQELIRMQI